MFDDKKEKLKEIVDVNKQLIKRLFGKEPLQKRSKVLQLNDLLEELHAAVTYEYKKKTGKDTMFLRISPPLDKQGRTMFLDNNSRYFCYKNDIAAKLNKSYHVKVEVYKYIPYIGLDFERKDEEKVKKMLNKEISNFTLQLSEKPQLAGVQYIPGTLLNYALSTSKYKAKLLDIMPDAAEYLENKNDKRKETLWNLRNIGADIANKKTKGKGTKVGIIDTGVDFNHPELEARFGANRGYDFITESNFPMDLNGHGTHVAGIIAGNTVGVASSATLYALRVLDEMGIGSVDSSIRALEWAADHGLDVVNMSLGSRSSSTPEEMACLAAYNAGVAICAAAGNEGYGPSYPAAYDKVIAVAAVDKNNDHAEFSNIWDTNDISAPGVGIYSTYLGGYTILSGTSMSTPHISGVCALVKSQNKVFGPQQLEDKLKETSIHLGNSGEDNHELYGAGLVRADKAIE